MKKYLHLSIRSSIALLFAVLLLGGCNIDTSGTSDIEAPLSKYEIVYNNIFLNEDFVDEIKHNPIDEKMQSSPKILSGNSGDLMSVTEEYYQDWKMQLEKTICDFQELLDQTDYQFLVSSYHKWNECLTDINALEKSIFYADKYSNDFGNTGSLHKLLLLTQKADKTKDFALYIMELYYLFTNEVIWIET